MASDADSGPAAGKHEIIARQHGVSPRLSLDGLCPKLERCCEPGNRVCEWPDCEGTPRAGTGVREGEAVDPPARSDRVAPDEARRLDQRRGEGVPQREVVRGG